MMAKRESAARRPQARPGFQRGSRTSCGAATSHGADGRAAGLPSRRRCIARPARYIVATPSRSPPEIPTWRRDPKTWQAEIERLRNAGDTARADAELAEYNRQQRAYAVGPDR